MEVAAVIPARMASTRYPGKPLCIIQGMTMIEHVYHRTEASEIIDSTYVATPDEEIREEAESFGAEVIMTGSHHKRATDRVAEAAESLKTDIVVVVQGDEPLIHPDMVDDAVRPVLVDEDVQVTNLAKPIGNEDDYWDEDNVKVVVDNDWNALYFSRAPIPHLHDFPFGDASVYHQVCIIPFVKDHLMTFVELDETPLEGTESIDMLRLLEHGYDVRVVESHRDTYPVDTPEDHEKVEALIGEDPYFETYEHRAK